MGGERIRGQGCAGQQSARMCGTVRGFYFCQVFACVVVKKKEELNHSGLPYYQRQIQFLSVRCQNKYCHGHSECSGSFLSLNIRRRLLPDCLIWMLQYIS